jgi:hypothetical protein
MADIGPSDGDDSSMMIPKSWLSKEHECVWEGATCGPPLSAPLLLNSTTASTTTAQVQNQANAQDVLVSSSDGTITGINAMSEAK